MPGVVLVYAGLLAGLAGLLSLLRPLRFLGIRSRRGGLAVGAAGLALVVAGALLPAPTRRVAARTTHLDDFMPAWQFGERHALRVQAPPARVYAAIRSVTADEIRLFRLLTSIRSPRLTRRAESILAPAPATPILDVALRTTFILLAEEPPRELVVGTVVVGRVAPGKHGPQDFLALTRPGYAKAAMSFHVAPREAGWSLVTT
ncbi:MAG TPA: hypothetical protein VF121_18660, partial [Thermoanaerobaculia bacterium]|nr:hypothetical protein [Thermoanaerobaculia bacterium]